MNSKEFVIWLKGFTEGVHDFNIIPKQWDYLKEKLAEVSDKPIRTSGYIGPVDQQMPSFTINSGSSSTAVSYIFPGTVTTFTTSTGSAWSYTATTDKTLLHD
jgi:hypothetical protein